MQEALASNKQQHATGGRTRAARKPEQASSSKSIVVVDYKAGTPSSDTHATNQHMILRLKVGESDSGDITRFCEGRRNRVAPAAQRAEAAPTRASPCSDVKMCFWCCHKFEGHTVRLPMRVTCDVVYGVGSFCSLSCAAAFNFNSSEIAHDVWRSYELINIVAQRSGLPVPVRPAGTRFSLKSFGGTMDIAKFREHTCMTACMPHPITQVTHFVEDSYSEARGSQSFIPLDNERVLKAKQNLMNYNDKGKSGIHSKMNLKSDMPAT